MELPLQLTVAAFVLLFASGFIWYMVESVLNSGAHRIGYVSSNLAECKPILAGIIKKYIPTTSKVTYIEPGCGLGHLTRWAAKEYPWKEVVGIDLRYSLLFLARVLAIGTGSKVRFVRKNVFNYTCPPGSLIYSYLYVPILKKLHADGKLAGCLVVSLTFEIPGITPTEKIPLKGWQGCMYVYDFRKA
jgi:SAM-dependent methyltransferase